MTDLSAYYLKFSTISILGLRMFQMSKSTLPDQNWFNFYSLESYALSYTSTSKAHISSLF